MSYKVNLTPQAKDDLRGIFEYIAFDLQSPQNAIGQFERLESSIVSLKEMSERFRIYDKEPWKSRNLRVMPVDNYLVLYIPDHEENVVTVLRVLYGGRNIDKQLGHVDYFTYRSTHRND